MWREMQEVISQLVALLEAHQCWTYLALTMVAGYMIVKHLVNDRRAGSQRERELSERMLMIAMASGQLPPRSRNAPGKQGGR